MFFLRQFGRLLNRSTKNTLKQIDKIDLTGLEEPVSQKLTALRAAIEEDPESDENWGKLGMTLFIHGYKENSIPFYEKAHSINEDEFRWVYFCAIAYDDLNSDQAIVWYEKSLLLNPSYPPLLIKLGNRYLLNGNLDHAKKSFTAAIKSGGSVPHAYLGLTKIAMENGDLVEADKQISKAVQMAPKYREAQALLADIYRRKGKKDKAELVFKTMSRLPERLDLKDPIYYELVNEGVSSFWCQVRGNNYLSEGELNRAEEEFKRALAIKPNEASYTSLGYVYQRQERYDAAMSHYESALKLNPEHVAAYNNMAVIYFELGDVEKAVSTIQEALRIDNESAEGYLNLGTFAKWQGKRKAAVKYFKKGMELAPGDRRFAYQLARLYASAPESYIRNGKESLRLAVSICEDNIKDTAECLDLLAMAFAENREYDKATKLAHQALRLASQSRDKKLAQEIERRRNLYKMKKPFRE
jgi:tetratricopeptide (TPR) repeat protein